MIRKLFVIVSLTFLATSAFALRCQRVNMTQSLFSSFDLVAKGKLEVLDPAKDHIVLLKVSKAWKGAKKGESVEVRYNEYWGHHKSLVASKGEHIVLASKKQGVYFVMPCKDIDSVSFEGRRPEEVLEALSSKSN